MLGSDQVLAAFAASEGKIPGAHFSATRQIGQQRRVLVVGVRGDHEHAADDVQLVEIEFGLGRARQFTLGDARCKIYYY